MDIHTVYVVLSVIVFVGVIASEMAWSDGAEGFWWRLRVAAVCVLCVSVLGALVAAYFGGLGDSEASWAAMGWGALVLLIFAILPAGVIGVLIVLVKSAGSSGNWRF